MDQDLKGFYPGEVGGAIGQSIRKSIFFSAGDQSLPAEMAQDFLKIRFHRRPIHRLPILGFLMKSGQKKSQLFQPGQQGGPIVLINRLL